jgi:SAM-dependent methyltransferase
MPFQVAASRVMDSTRIGRFRSLRGHRCFQLLRKAPTPYSDPCALLSCDPGHTAHLPTARAARTGINGVGGISRIGRRVTRTHNNDGHNLTDESLYWSRIAGRYDELYSDKWSQLEDGLVCRTLRKIKHGPEGLVLDLACGTGHGYELLVAALGISNYEGLDSSEAMLSQLAAKYPIASTRRASIDDLSSLEGGRYSLVTIFYSSASYANDPQRVLQQASRLLRPNGYLYYSVLGRWSLRRCLHWRWGAVEYCKTRGDHNNNAGVRAVTLSRRQIRIAARATRLKLIGLYGHGGLAGVWQHPVAWLPSRLIDIITPSLSHSQELVAQKVR